MDKEARQAHGLVWLARLHSVLVLLLAAPTLGGTDGAMAMLFEQQFQPGSLEQLKLSGTPVMPVIGVDIAGKLTQAVLKVGHLVHRGEPAAMQYGEIHGWLKGLLSFGVSIIIVFDNVARYPPKAARAHKERAESDRKNRDAAELLDGPHPSGCDRNADKLWQRVVHRETLLDLVAFVKQLCTQLKVRWVVAPFEADHLLAVLAQTGVITHVIPPHNDTDLPIYGIPSVLFRYRVDGSFVELRAREQLLGKLVHAKPTKPDALPLVCRCALWLSDGGDRLPPHSQLRFQLRQRHPHLRPAPLTRGCLDLPRPRSRRGVLDGGSRDVSRRHLWRPELRHLHRGARVALSSHSTLRPMTLTPRVGEIPARCGDRRGRS